MSMRLFVGLRPSEEFRTALSAVQNRLLTAGISGRYLDPANLHMTLAFIGIWSEDITPVLPAVPLPFPIILSHLGFFPEAKALWAGVEPSEALALLAGSVRDALDANNIPFDRKKFNPHITLVRKPVIPAGILLPEIEIPSVSMLVNEVCLYRSDRGENGMEYTVIGSTSKTVDETREIR